jgi:diaminohydroxyphosphoribosylaminopyrimidine deaminase / 5-amino-6-(5-phosphoribosylamino)uracil reductase
VATIYEQDSVGNVMREQTNRYAAGTNLEHRPLPAPQATLRTTNYTYDLNNNRTSSISGEITTNTTYDAANQLISLGGTSYRYDRNGNLVAYGGNSLAYDVANQWASGTVNGTSLAIVGEGQGRRVSQTVGTARTDAWYDLTGLTLETGVRQATYVRDLRGGLVSKKPGNLYNYRWNVYRCYNSLRRGETGRASMAISLSSLRPVVTVSYAQTLDGRLATINGSSHWISCPESLRFAHELRASHDAILVGVGTVLQDNPRLTVRHVVGRNPLRIVVDSTLRTPLSAAVLAGGAAAGTILAVTDRAPPERCAAARELGATLLRLPVDAHGRVDLAALLLALHERGIRSVMVEGGAQVITALLRARLVDRMAVCIAPKILGTGLEAIGDLGIHDLDHALRLTDVRVARYGDDLVLDGQVTFREERDGC